MSEGRKREVVRTSGAPGAIGPYNQAIVAGGFVHCSGQIPLDPVSMEVVTGDVSDQTVQVMKNLGAVLEAAGASFADVVRCTIFIKDMGDFGAINEVYAKSFEGMDPPARACVEVARLPKDVLVEIDCLALAPEGSA